MDTSTMTALVAEDELLSALVTRHILQSAGFKVFEATNGVDACSLRSLALDARLASFPTASDDDHSSGFILLQPSGDCEALPAVS